MSVENISIKRDLLLSKDVDNESVGDLMKEIYEINYDDDQKQKELNSFERKPIMLHIDTCGGSCYDGWGLIGTIEHSKTPVYTICEGYAMSMGLPILLSGKKRYAYKYSTILYHEISGWNWGKLTQLKEDTKQFDILQNLLDTYVLDKTKILQDKLKEVRERKIDWFISAKEALKLGIVDEVI